MGRLILCDTKRDVRPLYLHPSRIPVYSMEELVYYLEENFYLLDRNLVNHNMFVWLQDEMGLPKLCAKGITELKSHKTVYPAVMLILRASGLYNEEELAELETLFANMDGKTVAECQKLKADNYLKNGRYSLAVLEYDKLLENKNIDNMTLKLKSSMYHNKGVAYAKMFMFPEAAQMFYEAYRIFKRPESREAYMYALNYIKDDDVEDKSSEMDLTFEIMRDVFDKFNKASSHDDYMEERSKIADRMDAKGHMKKSDRIEILKEWKEKYSFTTTGL